MGHIAAVSDRSSGAETVPSAVPATEVLSAQVSELDTSSSACSRLAFAKMTGLWRTRLGILHILALSQPCVREIRARLARKLCGGSRGATCASQTESWRCRGMATCPCGMCGKYFCINCVQTYEETDGSLTHLCGRCVDASMNDSQDRRDAEIVGNEKEADHACDEEPNKKKMKEHDVINKAPNHGLKTEGIDYEKFAEFHGLDDHDPKQSKDR